MAQKNKLCTNEKQTKVEDVCAVPFPLTNPVSITYLTPGMVIDVSAMFVARITFLLPLGAEMKTFI